MCLGCTNVYGLRTDFGSFMLITKKTAPPHCPTLTGEWQRATGSPLSTLEPLDVNFSYFDPSGQNFSFVHSGIFSSLIFPILVWVPLPSLSLSLYFLCSSLNICPTIRAIGPHSPIPHPPLQLCWLSASCGKVNFRFGLLVSRIDCRQAMEGFSLVQSELQLIQAE